MRGERVRFQSLVQALWDPGPDLSFKRDVLLFLNTIVNSSLDVEERIETRSDMVRQQHRESRIEIRSDMVRQQHR